MFGVDTFLIDRPGPPEGPLDVLDLTAQGCKLKWRPPKDDGGSYIKGYVVEMKDGNGEWKKIGETKDGKATEFKVIKFNSG